MGGMSSQTNSTTGLGFVRQMECRGEKEVVVSKPVAPIIDEVGHGCTSNSESMATSKCREYLEEQPVRLEKNIINLSIEEATGFHDPVEKHADTGTPILCTIQSSSLGDISVTSKPTP